MLYGIGLSSTGASIERARMENLSNNLANIETPGFKEDLLTVMQRPVESKTWLEPQQVERLKYANALLDRTGGGVWLYESHTNFETGSPIHTGNDYDFMVSGSGFFQVEEVLTGNRYFTRAGRFAINPANGELVTPDGKYRVLDNNGNPIPMQGLIDGNGGERAMVGDRGEIQVQVGSTTVATGTALGHYFLEDNELRGLIKLGNNMYDLQHYGEGPRAVPKTMDQLAADDARRVTSKIKQQYIEGSGADPIMLMKQMIDVTRAYERNMNMLMNQNGTVSALIRGVAKV